VLPAQFKPSTAWVQSWKPKLQLDSVIRLNRFIAPKLDKLFRTNPYATEDDAVAMLEKTTIVGVLSVPHSIVVRKYIPNTGTNLWFTAYLWGIIYSRTQDMPFLDPGRVKLFAVVPKK
jgi:hypothetical protein